MSDKTKLLIESWRTWTGLGGKFGIKRDYRDPVEIPDEEDFSSMGPPALLIVDKTNIRRLILYRANKFGRISVMGMIYSSKTKKPCVTNSKGPTYSVNFSAVAEEYRGRGYGAMMYGLLMSELRGDDIGLTSDKRSGTSDMAASTWNRLGSTMGIRKKVTDAGNDTFDSTGKETPKDPNDDCDQGYTNDVKHSYIDGTGKYDSNRFRFKKQHREYEKKFGNLKSRLEREAMKAFKKAYTSTQPGA